MIWLIWTAAPRGLERGPCRGPARSVPTIGRCRDGVGARGPAFHLGHIPVAHLSIILLKKQFSGYTGRRQSKPILL